MRTSKNTTSSGEDSEALLLHRGWTSDDEWRGPNASHRRGPLLTTAMTWPAAMTSVCTAPLAVTQ
jgi:hypothetical protein